MTEYIYLGKVPGSPEERNKLLGEKIAMDERFAQLGLTFVQKRVIEFLISGKGYREDDIEVNKEFKVDLRELSFNVKADVALKIEGVIFLIIKCVINSMESWERHALAFCRVVESGQIPYAVITDGESARIIDVLKGGVASNGLDSIPSRQDALNIIKETEPCPYPEDRCEKEKRILYAFEAIKCPVDLNSDTAV